MKWEYAVIYHTAEDEDGRKAENLLDDYGKRGWELVAVTQDSNGYRYFLKLGVAE